MNISKVVANVDLCSNLIQQVILISPIYAFDIAGVILTLYSIWKCGWFKRLRNSIFQIPSVTFALFLGPWSDRAGRKLLIMFPYLGFLLVSLSMIINVYFFRELYVEFLWLENLSAFFGSYVIFLIGCYGFLADTTDQESRTIRIAVMDGCIFSTNILGNYVNGPIYKKFDYFGSFAGGYSLLSINIFSCPGSSIPDLGQSLSHWVTATLEFWHKEWLLRLETLQTFDQHDV